MEKKKLLFVAISVGIFLAFTIGAALLVFKPKSAAVSPPAGAGINVVPPIALINPNDTFGAQGNSGIVQPSSVDAADMVRRNGNLPGLVPLPGGTSQQTGGFHVQGSHHFSVP